jgi:hypothetical protein
MVPLIPEIDFINDTLLFFRTAKIEKMKLPQQKGFPPVNLYKNHLFVENMEVYSNSLLQK